MLICASSTASLDLIEHRDQRHVASTFWVVVVSTFWNVVSTFWVVVSTFSVVVSSFWVAVSTFWVVVSTFCVAVSTFCVSVCLCVCVSVVLYFRSLRSQVFQHRAAGCAVGA